MNIDSSATVSTIVDLIIQSGSFSLAGISINNSGTLTSTNGQVKLFNASTNGSINHNAGASIIAQKGIVFNSTKADSTINIIGSLEASTGDISINTGNDSNIHFNSTGYQVLS